MTERAQEGGLFFREAEGVTANVLLKKLRGDGQLSDADPRALKGFGGAKRCEVGLAIHPPQNGWWAAIDSADGAAGVGKGAWSTPALMANHLLTTAVWYRIYDDDLGLAMKLERGGSYFVVVAGTPREVRAWMEELGCPLDASRPAEASDDATLAAIAYAPADYESGPNRTLAAALFAIRSAMESGDAASARERWEALDPELAGLGLALLRGLTSDAARASFGWLADAILKEPMKPRGSKASVVTFAEEVVRRVAEETSDDARFLACLDRLDAIEGEAEARSAHAYTSGVERLAAMTFRDQVARSFECFRRLIARDEPAWNHVNLAIGTLLSARSGVIDLDGDAGEVARLAKARLPALGVEAQAAIEYNLACLYARAGDDDAALAHLERCPHPRSQNPHPEQDTDLASLWSNPRFALLIDREEDEEEEDLDDDDDEDKDTDKEPWVPPPDRAIDRLTIAFSEEGDARALSSRMGGLPQAPSADAPWPSTDHRPMDFVFQVVGKAAGGAIDMGDIHVLQAFADMEGDYYEANQVVIHRTACPAVMEPPTGVDVAEVQTMSLVAGHDDRVLIDVEWPDEDHPLHADHQAAWSHAWTDKVWGVPIGGNLDPDIRDSQGRQMRCLLQLVSHDDWFLWYVFVSVDFREAVLEIVRG
ncbi:MAG: hypothetical protein AAGE52_15795 [Myxococcota bacterium]